MVRTVHPPGAGGRPFGWVRAVRLGLAGLVRRDLEAAAAAARHVVFGIDLDEVCVGDAAAFCGRRLARGVLGLAAADAATGVRLAERARA
ncbi:hypothetical protein ABR737_01660 [Streptomyces sp. Edi2]|uniref:hypothetical protein n=1 Tax=Streptomyces sp. Edi2 TaxID=3162528 RepID=UPI003305666C